MKNKKKRNIKQTATSIIALVLVGLTLMSIFLIGVVY